MISILKKNNWLIAKTIVLITIIIPIGITAFEFFVKGKNSVVFLADYPTSVGITVAIYYALLLVAGIIWVIFQLKFFMTLKNEKTKNELLHLQSQVNPHFFFNMLNNLYGMIDKDTEKSKALILKLSDLMRYSIYEGEKNTVSLSEEVIYLKNYIALHKIRYHKEINIQFKTDIVDKNIKIMPLLLIILLENAFKHGVENLRENAYVHINLIANLKNLKRRLELAYPKKHKLNIINVNSVYKAQLELQL